MDWDELFKIEANIEKTPSPIIVDYIESLSEKSVAQASSLHADKVSTLQQGDRILDLGCGTGRHVIYIAQKGFDAHGLDLSDTALFYAKRWAKDLSLKVRIVKADMEVIPYPGDFFDALICFGVISHGTISKIKISLKEIQRILKSYGTVLITFLNISDFKKGNGEEIEENTFILDSGKERGIPHHFSTKGEVEKLLEDFELKDLWLDEAMVEYDGKIVSNRHWIARVKKVIPT